VILLDSNLDVRWIATPGIHAEHLGAVESEERVWLADTVQPKVVRLGPGGVIELVRDNLPLPGLDRSLAWRNGGVLLVAPGALVHVTANGGLAPGQGGFAFLTDIAAR
jgi:hypothetical protein